jgi:tRNA(Arg) A34 adenosine deaminase TadA
MAAQSKLSQVDDDLIFLRRTLDVAKRARGHGNHPFGAILVGADGSVLIEMDFDPPELADTTVYTSAEPCAMCAGAIYWAGIGRVVFGLSERRLKTITGDHAENPTLDLPCRVVFAAGQRTVEVVGPLIEDEAAALHVGAWDRRSE